jgi:GT2 family glycosyltransferase
VRSIFDRTEYPDYRVLVVSDGDLSLSTREALENSGCRVVDFEGPNRTFNFSRKVNFAVQHIETQQFVLLNDDMEVKNAEWLNALIEHSRRSEIGAVGGKLILEDERIQHVGVVIGVNAGSAHVYHRYPADFIGYNGFTHIVRNFSSVTAACLATRLDVFRPVGGFDENFPIDFNDTDFCLRLHRAGYRIVFTPYCELYHFEGSSLPRQQQNEREISEFQRRWGSHWEADPYYNINLSRDRLDYSLR